MTIEDYEAAEAESNGAMAMLARLLALGLLVALGGLAYVIWGLR